MIRDRPRVTQEETQGSGTAAETPAEGTESGPGDAKRTFAGTARRARGLPRLWARSLLIRAVFFTGLLTMISTMAVAAFLVQQVTPGCSRSASTRPSWRPPKVWT